MNASSFSCWTALSSCLSVVVILAIAPKAFLTSYLVWASSASSSAGGGAAAATGATTFAGAATGAAPPVNRASCWVSNCICCWSICMAMSPPVIGAAWNPDGPGAGVAAAGVANGVGSGAVTPSAGNCASTNAASRSRLASSPINCRKLILTGKLFCNCRETWVSIRLSSPSSMKFASGSAVARLLLHGRWLDGGWWSHVQLRLRGNDAGQRHDVVRCGDGIDPETLAFERIRRQPHAPAHVAPIEHAWIERNALRPQLARGQPDACQLSFRVVSERCHTG